MTRLRLPAGVAALALTAVLCAACAGAAPPPTPAPAPSQAAEPSPAGPAQVEAGAALDDPTSEPPRPEAKVVYVGRRDFAAVALTFDVGVNPGHVPEVLDTLKEHGVRATFGITGQWALTNRGLLKRIVEEGHAVINHSWSHVSFTGEDTETEPLTAEQIRDELERTEGTIAEIAGVSTKPYFRPPYGDFDSTVNRVAREAGYEYNVLWLVDGMGWDGRSTSYVVRVTLANAYKGAIFLYHTDNSREYAALEEIIEGLEERGLQIVTIPQLLGKEPMPTPTPGPTPTPAPTDIPPPPLASAPASASVPTLDPTPTPTPTPMPTPYVTIAYDDFESGAADGGYGWAYPWSTGPFVVGSGGAHSGSRYLDMTSTVIALRLAIVGPYEEMHLRFWARFSSVEAGDTAVVRVSNDGVTWTEYSLTSADRNDNAWRLYDIVLPFLPASQQISVRFQAQMDSQDDLWHIDDVELAAPAP
jgi:peptidoglycan/xylan/chitin deacetylase (PgdA/CDA1 family)